MGRTCPHCASSEIDEDPARGDATCMGCGTVLEESKIVSDVQFQEIGGGGHQAIGVFVNAENTPLGPGQPKPESREVTYYKGKKLIQEIASQLRINAHCINVAHNFYKMAVNMNVTRGRVRAYVVAACLYMTCRLEGTSHLLLDFSDVTQIVSLATRIVQRMKQDWMATGRRPTGICGAALLLAARAFNVNRAVSDIVKVVNISETVVRKRLDEFANTASGNLTIDEFKVVDLEDCEDPPAYQEARVRRQRDIKRQEEENQADKVAREFGTVHEELENAIKDKMKRSSYGAVLTGQNNDSADPEFIQAQEFVQPELIDDIYNVAESAGPTAEEQAFIAFQQQAEQFRPTLQSLGIQRDARSEAIDSQQPSTSQQDDLDLDLDEIDDEEINAYILSEQEASMKEKLWTMRNGAHMIEMAEKRRIKEEEEAKERENPKKKRRTFTKRPQINASNHNEAIYQVIQEKRLSSKINYEMLKDLGTETLFTQLEEDKPVQEAEQSLPEPTVEILSPPPSVFKVPEPPSMETKKAEFNTTQLAPQVSTPVVLPTKPKAASQRYKHAKVLPTAAMRAKKV